MNPPSPEKLKIMEQKQAGRKAALTVKLTAQAARLVVLIKKVERITRKKEAAEQLVAKLQAELATLP